LNGTLRLEGRWFRTTASGSGDGIAWTAGSSIANSSSFPSNTISMAFDEFPFRSSSGLVPLLRFQLRVPSPSIIIFRHDAFLHLGMQSASRSRGLAETVVVVSSEATGAQNRPATIGWLGSKHRPPFQLRRFQSISLAESLFSAKFCSESRIAFLHLNDPREMEARIFLHGGLCACQQKFRHCFPQKLSHENCLASPRVEAARFARPQ